MTLAGVDEAGYGPILGPLVLGQAAFRVEGARDAVAVEAAVREALATGGHGVRVDDSKRVHRPGAGPRAVEETVLAFLAARDGRLPPDGRALLAALGAGEPPADHPWYGGLPARPVPLAADGAVARERGGLLAAALRRSGVVLEALRVRVLPEGRYNEAVAREGNKATVLFREAAALVERAAAGPGPVEVLCDRHGARSRYGPLLEGRFPGGRLARLAEGRRASSYELDAGPGGRRIRLRFEEKADGSSAAVALASMAAKYVREAWMASLNDWFLREAPGVRGTAGYWTDGLRFLAETAAARRRLGIDDALLVRSR